MIEQEILPKPQTDLPLPEKEISANIENKTLQGDVLQNKWIKLGIIAVVLLIALGGAYFLGKNSAITNPTPIQPSISPSQSAVSDDNPPTPTLDPKYANFKLYSGNPSDLYNCDNIKNLPYQQIRTRDNEFAGWIGYLNLQGNLVSRNKVLSVGGPNTKVVYLEISPQQTGVNKIFFEDWIQSAKDEWAGGLTENGNLLAKLGEFSDPKSGEPSTVLTSTAELSTNFQNVLNANLDKEIQVNLRLYITIPSGGSGAPTGYTGACKIEAQ